MKIFILDKYKITKFELPKKIEDSFLVPYNKYDTKVDSFVTIESNDDKWQIRSNGNVNLENDLDKVVLGDYDYHKIKVLGQEEMPILFALPSVDEESYNLDVNKLTSITIGKSAGNIICYNNELTDQLHAEIKKVNEDWYLAASANDQFRTYVNGYRVLTTKLNVGDVIFINGLKIIWMKNFIKINNPKKSTVVKGLTAHEDLDVDNTKYDPATEEEINVELYKDDDYFYHMPRLVPIIEGVEIKIDTPPEGGRMDDMPFLLTLGTQLTMIVSTLVMVYNIIRQHRAGAQILDLLPQILICSAMLIGSVIMPRIIKAYQKRKARRYEKERQTKYKEYLSKIDGRIQSTLKQQLQVLRENNLSAKDCYNAIMKKTRHLWCREILDDDFLRIRLGVGDINSFINVVAPEEHFSLHTDNLQESVYEIDRNSKKLKDAPVTISLTNQTILSFVLNCSYGIDYMNGLLLQILALQSSIDLKVVILTNKQNEKRWEFAKFLPHCFNDTKELRFFATTPNEYNEISSYLEEELKTRYADKDNKEDKYKNYSPYYLIITDDYRSVKDIPFIDFLQNQKINAGFSLITISNSMKNLPNKCEKFIIVGEKESCILDKKLSTNTQIVFSSEYEKNLDMNSASIKLSNIPTLSKDALTSLPSSLTFLDMYGVGKIEQLNIYNRWQTNSPVSSLSTPIGVRANGETFRLDLHEKFHGPHGLIAGSTGSGKSEFIITYILSMCINYHPYEVQFVLIDYKGGGLAGAFENKETGVKIPHLVGTITNLDTAEMNRTLVSISSELKRRQMKFNEVKDKLDESTMDIYKYQRLYREGLIDEPMSHLFIISDEFAELKSQQPEFLNELVSTARIGRSLGVHLILATQKPTGVVNDQIWSNSKFKVCLKVQDRSDSMEMLKRPEAASIKEPGRFYLQVGYDDYFDLGQSGWGGAKYVPTDKLKTKRDDSIVFIDNVGNIIKSVNDAQKKETTQDLGDQLTNIVKYIYMLGEKENIHTRKMWLDKIPDTIYISNVKTKYKYTPIPYRITPVIGEFDNPQAQSQGILNLNLHENIIIYGKPGSGKENLLSTILWSSIIEHRPEEVNFYIVDCGAETLKMFYKMPHVGEVITQDEPNKVVDMFGMLSDEIARRKETYADYAGSYENYCENSGKKDPLIVTIINNYDVFSETFGKLSEDIQPLFRDGVKYGVVFIITCLSANTIRGRMLQMFEGKIVLQMPNPDNYRDILSSPKGQMPSEIFGRGLIALNGGTYEFQTALITEFKQINNVIREASKQLINAYPVKARKIPQIPELVTPDTFDSNITLDKLPIGYNVLTKVPYTYNFTSNRINCIVSETMPGRINFVKGIVKELVKIPKTNIKIVDFVNAFDKPIEGTTIYKDKFDKTIVDINNEIANEAKLDGTNVYIITGVGVYEKVLSRQIVDVFDKLMMATTALQKSYFIFVDNYSTFRNITLTNWYKAQVDSDNGIWLGPNVANQMAFNVANVDMEVRNLDFPYLGVAIVKNEFTVIKYVVDGDNNEK